MKTYKILLDSRRKINSGIGRVSQWLSENIISDNEEKIEVINLSRIGDGYSDYDFGENKVVYTDIKPFSHEEFYELPDLVSSIGVDLYINPQTTWSPLHQIPSINIVHDLWAIKNPEWLPSDADLITRFSLDNINYFEYLSDWFRRKDAELFLTDYGYSEWLKANESRNIIWLGCWAQYAATVSMSSQCIAVSSYVKSEIQKYFKCRGNIKIIYNTPQGFTRNKINNDKKSHFLVLSKLENRKNLDFLLDAYIEYCNFSTEIKPLIIAGDPGYASVAKKLISKIENLSTLGYPVNFKPSVTDKKLTELFSESIALIFPSHFEGFGLPALEAMLSRIPVIATKTGMMATELGNYAALFNGNDLKELSRLLVLAQEDKLNISIEDAKFAVENFIDKCNSRYEWNSVIRELKYSNKK